MTTREHPKNDAEAMDLIYREKAAKRREYLRQWRKANADRLRAKRAANWEAERAAFRSRYAANPDYFRGRVERRHAMRRRRTPAWANRKEIEAVYRSCPQGMHVDHIVPLDGFTAEGLPVTGLHVAWNLQILTPSENVLKGNRMRTEDGERAENGNTKRLCCTL